MKPPSYDSGECGPPRPPSFPSARSKLLRLWRLHTYSVAMHLVHVGSCFSHKAPCSLSCERGSFVNSCAKQILSESKQTHNTCDLIAFRRDLSKEDFTSTLLPKKYLVLKKYISYTFYMRYTLKYISKYISYFHNGSFFKKIL